MGIIFATEHVCMRSDQCLLSVSSSAIVWNVFNRRIKILSCSKYSRKSKMQCGPCRIWHYRHSGVVLRDRKIICEIFHKRFRLIKTVASNAARIVQNKSKINSLCTLCFIFTYNVLAQILLRMVHSDHKALFSNFHIQYATKFWYETDKRSD